MDLMYDKIISIVPSHSLSRCPPHPHSHGYETRFLLTCVFHEGVDDDHSIRG